ncbi:AAA family ATPase [Deinococcus radiopugnans]|uniref:AAA family ATPase n=1 Tax=Deinococcus radiopugnans ATCC 19172 TaxID=585398 RepID=A0A5C4XUY5_9DEIO|nr:AAA family ATPase [Deinococcus radiopugnans]MBB6018636.1 SpoVK/Ycf46/Vps4 family AAA+-type ATPase [Deinococcus radiopugnans ATCC 19172]TNM67047.1 AAA family ATPase [Deinococcus radiopugnans ATCC 19172]
MNPLIERAQQTSRRIEAYLQEIEDADVWTLREQERTLPSESYIYILSLMGHLIYSDGLVHKQEIELAKQYFSSNAERTIEERLRVLSSKNHSKSTALPNFLKAAVYFDAVKNTRYTDAIIGLIEKFGNIVIAVDGNKLEVEIRVLGEIISNLIDLAVECREATRQALKKGTSKEIGRAKKEEEKEPSLDDLLTELRSMIGLQRVKQEVVAATNLVRVRQLREEMGLPAMPVSLHMVFTGNPGTGKTTVARLLAQIYREIGLLEEGHLVEVDRSGLIADYLGQTAGKVQAAVQSARGGILFIDEAYALKTDARDSYGQEAINTLLKAMEDHRDDLIIIVAGYTAPINEFLETNPGLRSRFNRFVHFDDYDGEELLNIFTYLCDKHGYSSTQIAKHQLKNHFSTLYEGRGENFGNARDVRNVFETILKHQAERVVAIHKPTADDLSFIDLADIAWLFERPNAEPVKAGRA